jgi:hypothetical protein
MARYIDADALTAYMNKRYDELYQQNGAYDHYNSGYSEAIDAVEDAPTVDVVTVVRCKDCKHRNTDSCAMGIECSCCGCQSYWCNDNDYCSWGERR